MAASPKYQIIDRDLSAPPSIPGPLHGASYIVAASGTGDWAGQDGNIATFIGTSDADPPTSGFWMFVTPTTGWNVWAADEGALLVHNGSTWDEIAIASLYLPLAGGTLSGDLDMGSNNIVALADGTAAAHAIARSQADARKLLVLSRIGTVSTTSNAIIWGSQAAATLQKISIIVSTSIVAADGNYWSIQVQNMTAGGTPFVLNAARETTTGGGGFTAHVSENLGAFASGEDALSADEVLEAQFTRNGTPSNLLGTVICLQYEIAT